MIAMLAISAMFTLAIFRSKAFLMSLRRKNLAQRLVPEDHTKSAWGVFHRSWSSFLKLEKQSSLQFLFSMPDVLDLLAVAMLSGESLFSALSRITPRANGPFAVELRQMLTALELGSTYEQELEAIVSRSKQRQVSEFANKLHLTLTRGTPVATMLSEQSRAIREEINNLLLKQAGKNETKMLIPLVFLILPVTILFAIYPSLQLLNINYI